MWLQDPAVLRHYVEGAQRTGLAIAHERERGYRVQPWLFGWTAKHFLKGYGLVAGAALLAKRHLNAGFFAGQADAPHWAAWAARYEAAIRRSGDLVPHDQFSLVQTVHSRPIAGPASGRLATAVLPPEDNWICDRGVPMWNDDTGRFCKPYAPYDPIGAVHLAGPAKATPYAIRRTHGGSFTSFLTYGASPDNPVTAPPLAAQRPRAAAQPPAAAEPARAAATVMSERFLVTGGAGYVGSHMVDMLVDAGAAVTVVDDLRQGHRAALPRGVELVVANIADEAAMQRVLAGRQWHAIVHFAAMSLVGESMTQPLRYFRENTSGAFNLIDVAVRHEVPRFVLSSTANLFGEPDATPIGEDAPLRPSSPYGESKGMIERALYWAGRQHGMRSACLRYFNAAGADVKGRIGEDHDPETHLIPLVIDAALGRRDVITVFGEDYPTRDGTCIRDYVHVSDLAAAHLCALRRLDAGSVTYNLGNGQGHSVQEVIAAVEAVSGLCVPVRMGERRPGDPATLVAASSLIKSEAGWTPRHDSLRAIVETAYAWRKNHPSGYGDR